MRLQRFLPAFLLFILAVNTTTTTTTTFIDNFKGKVNNVVMTNVHRHRTKRVANATNAINKIDFMVSLESKPFWFFMPYEHVCGGTVISSFFILSAAHCFFGKRSIDSIGYGSNDRRHLRHLDIDVVIIPKDFKKKFDPNCNCAFDEDLAMIKTQKIIPVSSLDNLPTLNRYRVKAFKKATLFAWGQIEDGTYADCLREANFVIISNFAAFTRSTKNVFGYGIQGQTTLPGDSGSPLMSIDLKKLYGIHVGQMGDVTVSVSTEYYANWIFYVMYEYKDLIKGRKERIIRCCDTFNATAYHIRRISS